MVDNLERIKMDFSEYETCHGIYTEDVKWLIEQAEKYQKLEDAWKRDQSFSFMKTCSEIIEQ
jgi:hypothetical protein